MSTSPELDGRLVHFWSLSAVALHRFDYRTRIASVSTIVEVFMALHNTANEVGSFVYMILAGLS